MCSENQRELYTQFEPDANEIVFGQRTAPDRPLTQQELSKRKKIVLKLVDQKLKFELIELMRKQQEMQVYSASTSTIDSHQNPQKGHRTPKNEQTEFGNAWQPSTRPQTPYTACGDDHPNRLKIIELHSQPSSTYLRQSNTNLIEVPIQQFERTETKTTSTSLSNVTMSTRRNVSPDKVISKASSMSSDACALTSRSLSRADDNERAPRKTSLLFDNSKNTSQIRKQTVTGGKLIGNKSSNFLGRPEERPSHNAPKRKQPQSSNDCPKKTFMDETKNATFINLADGGRGATEEYAIERNPDIDASSMDTTTEETIDLTINDVIEKSATAETAIRNKSMEWTAMNQLVTQLFRNKANNWEPLSASDVQLKNEILIQMAINPNDIRSHPSAQIVRQRVGDRKLVELVQQGRSILSNLSRTDPDNQESFFESHRTLVENLKNGISHRDNVGQHFGGQHSRIANLISPFLCPGQNSHDLTEQLVKNPYALLSNEAVTNRIVAGGQSVSNIMKSIKAVLDQFITVRLPKKFNVPTDRFIDVPFVVKLFDRSTKMTPQSAGDLTNVLIDSINCMKVQKPALRDIKFKDGTLEILCINSKSFDWLKNTLSNHLGVDICPVKNAIPYDQLKTICIRFHVPQYFHFNTLMEQLRVDNPRLLTKRWELRSPRSKDVVDSTKCVYVGVDVDSLIILEEMNRVGTLRDSSVYFDITYGDNEENFMKMTFEKKKKPRNRHN